LTLLLVVLAVSFQATTNSAHAQVILRDAEAEWFIRKISTPIFEAAGVTPSSVEIYLIYDSSINAPLRFIKTWPCIPGLSRKPIT
jgi:predicted Zn-dependent protease